MAVIKCPECHKEMSDVAEKCPNCGYPYAEKVAIYHQAMRQMRSCDTENGYRGLAELFRSVSGIFDSDEQVQVCIEKAEACRIREVQREAAREKQKEEQAKQKQKLFRKLAKLLVFAVIVGSVCFVAYNIIHSPKEISFNSVEEMRETIQGNWQTTFYVGRNVGHWQLRIVGDTAYDRILSASQNGVADKWDTWNEGPITFYPNEGRFSVHDTMEENGVITWEVDHNYLVLSWKNGLIIRETRYTNKDKDRWYHRY